MDRVFVLCAVVAAVAALRLPATGPCPAGWEPPLPSRVFSGFVDVSATSRKMKVHYVYVESEKDPSKDPTIVWTNGGPGASSMFGLLVELGPLVLDDRSTRTDAYERTGVPTLFYNAFGWTTLGSLLVFDWPPPVGFSQCDDAPGGGGGACGDWDDERMADASHAALEGWYDLFPERRANDLYVTGESYAGIYVPKLVEDPDEKRHSRSAQGLRRRRPRRDRRLLRADARRMAQGHLLLRPRPDQQLRRHPRHVRHGLPQARRKDAAGCQANLDEIDAQVGGYRAGLYDDGIYEDDLRCRLLPTASSPPSVGRSTTTSRAATPTSG